MRRFLGLFLCLALILPLMACAGNNNGGNGGQASPSPEPQVEGALTDLMKKIYEGTELAEMSLMETEVTAENEEYFLGVAGLPYSEALASEPMISAIAHSVVLLRVKDGEDVADVKTKIKENVDGRKWICVGVEDENIVVDNIGNLVILIMDEESAMLQEQFQKLKG